MQNTLIDGTVYKIVDGKENIDGTTFSIKSGGVNWWY